MSGMKKIGSRQFQKQFSKVAETLKTGDVVQVTKRGKPFVQVTKLGRKRIPTPNFAKRLATDTYSIKQGEALLAHLDEAVS
jgi:antitoxin (DNA-binding transcriptional repressor) of toxin-antitoxin stability system